MKSSWVDFRALRARLKFQSVLEFYHVEVKCKGTQHHGYCPLPSHQGKRNSPSFSANLEKGIFQCFGCGAKGNVLDFAALMENVDSGNGTALREVALKLQHEFCRDLESTKPVMGLPTQPIPQASKQMVDMPTAVNEPLDFELKGLDPKHPYLLGRGFSAATIERFGLGYCSRGLLRGRVAIPLHDIHARIIGYAGRVVDDASIGEDNPRYRFPGERKREGKIIEFRKTLFLYNAFRMREPVNDLVLVEGFTSVWFLDQNGISNVVATMGTVCSPAQAEILISLVKSNGRVWIIPDGDKAGERLAQSLLTQIAPHRLIRWVKLPEGKQPTDLKAEELETTFRL